MSLNSSPLPARPPYTIKLDDDTCNKHSPINQKVNRGQECARCKCFWLGWDDRRIGKTFVPPLPYGRISVWGRCLSRGLCSIPHDLHTTNDNAMQPTALRHFWIFNVSRIITGYFCRVSSILLMYSMCTCEEAVVQGQEIHLIRRPTPTCVATDKC